MKRIITKYSLGLLSLGLLMASCDQDIEGTLFDSSGKNQYSVGAKVRTVEMLPEDNNSFKVEIARVDAATSTTVSVVLELGNGVPSGTFRLKSNLVDFNVGEYVGYAEVVYDDIDELSPTGQYKMTLKVAAEDASPSNYVSMAITAFRKLTYEHIGTGELNSSAFGGAWPIEVMKAKEGDVYILKEMYDIGYDVQLVIVDGMATISAQAAWKHGTYGDIYVETVEPAAVNGKTIVMMIDHFVPNLGSFGEFEEVLILP